jgi:hypothetical protein
MGHLLHGSPRAFCSHVLRYGLRTIRGRTGGFNVDAPATLARSAAAATVKDRIAFKMEIMGIADNDAREAQYMYRKSI